MSIFFFFAFINLLGLSSLNIETNRKLKALGYYVATLKENAETIRSTKVLMNAKCHPVKPYQRSAYSFLLPEKVFSLKGQYFTVFQLYI